MSAQPSERQDEHGAVLPGQVEEVQDQQHPQQLAPADDPNSRRSSLQMHSSRSALGETQRSTGYDSALGELVPESEGGFDEDTPALRMRRTSSPGDVGRPHGYHQQRPPPVATLHYFGGGADVEGPVSLGDSRHRQSLHSPLAVPSRVPTMTGDSGDYTTEALRSRTHSLREANLRSHEREISGVTRSPNMDGAAQAGPRRPHRAPPALRSPSPNMDGGVPRTGSFQRGGGSDGSPRRGVSFRDDIFSEVTEDLGNRDADLDSDATSVAAMRHLPSGDYYRDRRSSSGARHLQQQQASGDMVRAASFRSMDSDADSEMSDMQDGETAEQKRLQVERRAAQEHRRAIADANARSMELTEQQRAAEAQMRAAVAEQRRLRQQRSELRTFNQQHPVEGSGSSSGAGDAVGFRTSAGPMVPPVPLLPPRNASVNTLTGSGSTSVVSVRPLLEVTPATPQTGAASASHVQNMSVMDDDDDTSASHRNSDSFADAAQSPSAQHHHAPSRGGGTGGGAGGAPLPPAVQDPEVDEKPSGGRSSTSGSSSSLRSPPGVIADITGVAGSPSGTQPPSALDVELKKLEDGMHAVAVRSAQRRRPLCFEDLPNEVLRHAIDHFLSISQHYGLRLVSKRWNALVTSNCILWMRKVPNYLSHGYTSTTECNVFRHSRPSTTPFNRMASRQSFGNLTVATSTMSEDTMLLSREQSWTSDSQMPSRFARPAQIHYCFQGCAYRTWRALKLQKALSAIRRFHKQKDKYFGGAAAVTVLFPPAAGLGTAVCLTLSIALIFTWSVLFSELIPSRVHPDALVITFVPLWVGLLCVFSVGTMWTTSPDCSARLAYTMICLGAAATAVLEFALVVLQKEPDTSLVFRVTPYAAVVDANNGTEISIPRDAATLGALAMEAIVARTSSLALAGDPSASVPRADVYHLLSFLPLIAGAIALLVVTMQAAVADTAVARHALSLFCMIDKYCGAVAPIKRLPRRIRPGGSTHQQQAQLNAAQVAAEQRRRALLQDLIPQVDPIGGFANTPSPNTASTNTGSASGTFPDFPTVMTDGGSASTSQSPAGPMGGPPLAGSPNAAGEGETPSPPQQGGGGETNDQQDTNSATGANDDGEQHPGGDDKDGGDGDYDDKAATQPAKSYDVRPFMVFNYAHAFSTALLLAAVVLVPLELSGWTGYTRLHTVRFPNVANTSVAVVGLGTSTPTPFFTIPDSEAVRRSGYPNALAALVWVAESSPSDNARAPTRLQCDVQRGGRLSFLFIAAALGLVLFRHMVGMRSSWRKVGRRLLPFTAAMAAIGVCIIVLMLVCVAFVFTRVGGAPTSAADATTDLLAMTVGRLSVAVDSSTSGRGPASTAPPGSTPLATVLTTPPPTTTAAATLAVGTGGGSQAQAEQQRANVVVSCIPRTAFTTAEIVLLAIAVVALIVTGVMNIMHDKSRYFDYKMVKYRGYFERLIVGDDLTTLGIDMVVMAVQATAEYRRVHGDGTTDLGTIRSSNNARTPGSATPNGSVQSSNRRYRRRL